MGADLDEFIHQLIIRSKLCAYKDFFKKKEEEEKEKLKKWVKDNYSCDVFDDGYITGTSWAAYEVGSILGMKLEEPNEPKYEEE